MIDHDFIFILPSGGELDIASAKGDLERAAQTCAAMAPRCPTGRDDLRAASADLPRIAELLDVLAGLKTYTVIGVYCDVDGDYQRYASCFHADNVEHAEEQAVDEGGESLVIAGVIEGKVVLADV